MSFIDEIRIAQRDAGEAAVLRNLERQGLGSVGSYATAEESASVIREATPDEQWLHAQLDRIDPDRLEMGSAGDTPALMKLVFELRDTKTRLQGEADVMRTLLEEALKVLATIEPEDDGEYTRLRSLQKSIIAIVEMKVVHR